MPRKKKKISPIFSTVILNSTTVNESNVELFSIVKCIITISFLYKQKTIVLEEVCPLLNS